jgi:pyruvate ferredoxin oxidoreductase delta subunit
MNIATNPSSTNINKTGGWRTFVPVTDLNKCIGCGTCSRVCPENAVAMDASEKKQKPVTDLDFCKGCGLCAVECPVKCIVMELDKK